jgi:hypothetical protein
MAKGLKQPKPFELMSIEEQIEFIEKQTENVIKRLPELKEALTTYDDVSKELYNMTEEQIKFASKSYQQSIRGGEITTPTGKKALSSYVQQLSRYGGGDISQLAHETAQERFDNFLEHVRSIADDEELEYLDKLVELMSEEDILGFTRSKYFLDTGDYSSDSWAKAKNDFDYTINTMKLEVYLQSKGYDTEHIYNDTMGYVEGSKPKSTSKGIKKGVNNQYRKED